jgi:hypothetical protein
MNYIFEAVQYNTRFTDLRTDFICKLNQIDNSFRSFNNHDLFMYVIAM